jgi:hypothetical protein
MARPVGHKGRFALAYLLLGAAVGAGLGAFIVLLQRPGPKPPTPWSAWKPSVTAVGATAEEIASHIGGAYRFGDGQQLARVVLDAPPPAAANVEAIALAANGSSLQGIYDPGKTILYTLCGESQSCALKGQGSIARGDVLRRETLELALYTLKYTPSDGVAVFFPPGRGEKAPKNVFFFSRADLKSQLKRPLRVTLPQLPPTRPGHLKQQELQTIDQLTSGHRYSFGVQTANGGRRVLVLQPVA